MLNKIKDLFDQRSDQERGWDHTVVSMFGGPDQILRNREDLWRMAKMIENEEKANARAPTPTLNNEGQNANTSKHRQQLASSEFTSKELDDVQTPLATLLAKRRTYFVAKLDMLSSQVSHVERNTRLILHRMDARLAKRIDDPDIRLIWKNNV